MIISSAMPIPDFRPEYERGIAEADDLLHLFDRNTVTCPRERWPEAREQLKALKARWRDRMHKNDNELGSAFRHAYCDLYISAGSRPGPKWVSDLHSAQDHLRWYLGHSISNRRDKKGA